MGKRREEGINHRGRREHICLRRVAGYGVTGKVQRMKNLDWRGEIRITIKITIEEGGGAPRARMRNEELGMGERERGRD